MNKLTKNFIEATMIDSRKVIYKLLEEKNINQSELAKKLKISRQRVNDLLRKGGVTIRTLGRIAYALDKKLEIKFIDKDKHND